MTTEPRCLFLYASKTNRTRTWTHILNESADESKLNDRILNKKRRTENDRSPLPTSGFYVCVCLCEAGLDTTGLILRIKGPRRLMWRPALSRGCFLIPSSSGADWIRRNTCLWYKCKGAIWILRTSSKPEVSHQTPCCWSTNLRACAAGVCTGERGSDCSCFWKTF